MAHIQKNGKAEVIEKAGEIEHWNMGSAYSWLLQHASSLGGWLLNHTLTEVDLKPDATPMPKTPPRAVTIDNTTGSLLTDGEPVTIGAPAAFGEYKRKFYPVIAVKAPTSKSLKEEVVL